MRNLTLYILLTIGTRKNIFIFQLIAYILVNGEMLQHQMLFCFSSLRDGGNYYRPKHVAEVIVDILTNRYAIILT